MMGHHYHHHYDYHYNTSTFQQQQKQTGIVSAPPTGNKDFKGPLYRLRKALYLFTYTDILKTPDNRYLLKNNSR